MLGGMLWDSVQKNGLRSPNGPPTLSKEVKEAIGAYMDRWWNKMYPGDTPLGDQGGKEFHRADMADLMALLKRDHGGAAVDQDAVYQYAVTCHMKKHAAAIAVRTLRRE